MKTRYIFQMGTLKMKDNSLYFYNEKVKLHLPIEQTREIYLFNEVSINTKLLDQLSRYNITLHFFNYHGYYVGSFFGKDYLRSGKLVVNQVRMFLTSRETVAREFVRGIAKNIHHLLYHYYRHGNKELKEYLDWLRDDVDVLLGKAFSVNQIMMVEGMIWSKFYSSFKYFLHEDFVINKRVRRPPDNPINALISFGNSLLYAKVSSQLYHTHLNQEVSYLHEPSTSRYSLSLDVAEVFKPTIVFKTIFELVNRKKLVVEKHFDKELNYCLLNEEGKKIFVTAFEERLLKTFKHSRLKRNVSYMSCIKNEGYKLIKMMNEGELYTSFSEKDGC